MGRAVIVIQKISNESFTLGSAHKKAHTDVSSALVDKLRLST